MNAWRGRERGVRGGRGVGVGACTLTLYLDLVSGFIYYADINRFMLAIQTAQLALETDPTLGVT